jgi:hypothetical protein
VISIFVKNSKHLIKLKIENLVFFDLEIDLIWKNALEENASIKQLSLKNFGRGY